jgi:hypothetical protein
MLCSNLRVPPATRRSRANDVACGYENDRHRRSAHQPGKPITVAG